MDDKSGNPKLEWMYKTGQDLINREEYLTGRKVDKQFEELTSEQNCVEHEVLPASISRNVAIFDKHDQVDILRKQMEDPLVAIKQREMEARRKILENPVKLKELHRLLKQEKTDQQPATSKTSKDKKSKKKQKKSRSSSSSSSGSEDLDKLLMEKYKKIKDGNDSDDDSNFIEKKFRTLKNELDKMVKNNKKRSLSRGSSDDRQGWESRRSMDKKRRDSPDRRRRISPESSRRDMQGRNNDWKRREVPDRRYDNSRAREYKKRSRTPEKKRFRSPEKRKDRSRSREKNRRESPKRKKSRSPRQESPKKDRRASPQRNSNKKALPDIPIDHKNDSKYRNPSPPKQRQMYPKRKSSSGSRSPSPAKRPMQFDDSDDERRARKPKSFGLVTASGEKISLERKEEVRRYTKEELKVSRDAPKKHEIKRKKPLTEEEMEAMRTEMMKNADWREKDREKTVKKHRALEEEEKSKHQKDFDKDFLNKHMKKAQDQVQSVATRIKSNLNNIQRTSRTMDSNFVRR